ncbi:acetyl-CoA hydrolase/succinyl-CoA:acetate CoA-transferase [Rhizobium sp. RU20A]|uniref:succinate CoA transferase n=1 Tax=Rhizobium sp. RU20A TaxID=1907412 RepID=UPI000953EDBB|nr:succinate CoA transferase [Rhizobium sp. RU20A]SIQ09017.1 acetyl-CoA hydrolase/succinyl-CoA:acetate CoA-transferase [Rhizobium sp. RU20A]
MTWSYDDIRARIGSDALMQRLMTAADAARLITDGMVVGMSGFTRAGDAKAVPLALAQRALADPLKITLMTGASLGHDIDRRLTEAGVLSRRLPFQSDAVLRAAINRGAVMFIDQHLSETVEQLRSGQLAPIDISIVEAVAVKADGAIVPTTSVGNSASFATLAERVIVELNMGDSPALEGLHDIYLPERRPSRTPIPVVTADSRVGTTAIRIPADKIAAIVVTDKADSFARVESPDAQTSAIAGHLLAFFERETAAGRLDLTRNPLQAGIGVIANAVLSGLKTGPFDNLVMYSEVLQDSTFELIDAGKLRFASGASMTLGPELARRVFADVDRYRDRLVLRPQEISNHPEIIRRLGVVAINTALEFDIYGNVNSTHVFGTDMMNGIGGSGDFARNAYLSIFIARSTAKGGALSSVVPMVSHVDHTEHDVDILVTEHGLADLRGLAPRERAGRIIAACADPAFRPALADYLERAIRDRGGHTPHILEEALSWHARARATGRM